ncbi:unnamed protein product [Arabidopsis halleri]
MSVYSDVLQDSVMDLLEHLRVQSARIFYFSLYKISLITTESKNNLPI